jgi:hypothetical protein
MVSFCIVFRASSLGLLGLTESNDPPEKWHCSTNVCHPKEHSDEGPAVVLRVYEAMAQV